MSIYDVFCMVNSFLPEGVKAKSLSIYPLPYPGFHEVYVEGDNGKRYRALAGEESTLSDFIEFSLPGGVTNVK